MDRYVQRYLETQPRVRCDDPSLFFGNFSKFMAKKAAMNDNGSWNCISNICHMRVQELENIMVTVVKVIKVCSFLEVSSA